MVWTAGHTFDNLDVSRMAVLLERTVPGLMCAYHVAPPARIGPDGNAIQETADGSLLDSSRHQDWLIKVAYDHGAERLVTSFGRWVRMATSLSIPRMPDPGSRISTMRTSKPPIRARLLVFDDGNTRIAMNGGNSRQRHVPDR